MNQTARYFLRAAPPASLLPGPLCALAVGARACPLLHGAR